MDSKSSEIDRVPVWTCRESIGQNSHEGTSLSLGEYLDAAMRVGPRHSPLTKLDDSVEEARCERGHLSTGRE